MEGLFKSKMDGYKSSHFVFWEVFTNQLDELRSIAEWRESCLIKGLVQRVSEDISSFLILIPGTFSLAELEIALISFALFLSFFFCSKYAVS